MERETVPQTLEFEMAAAIRPSDTQGYARVSTPDQCLSAQRSHLLDAGPIRVFTDVASGKRSDRPGLTELIDRARPGDRLCVTRLDSLRRSLRELLETVDVLKARGIHLVSLEERLDTSSAAGEFVFHVFGAIAHFERRLIAERTREGIAAARKRGRSPGRPPERSGTCRGEMPDRPEQFGYVVTSHTKSSFSVPSPAPILHNHEFRTHQRMCPRCATGSCTGARKNEPHARFGTVCRAADVHFGAALHHPAPGDRAR